MDLIPTNLNDYFGKDSNYALKAALEENGYNELISEVEGVLLEITGANDVADWHWIVKLKSDPQWAYITGWCDYTGWD